MATVKTKNQTVSVYTGKKYGRVTLVAGSTAQQAKKALAGLTNGDDKIAALRAAGLLRGSDIDLAKLAESLGYESIKWEDSAECYVGYGSSDPFDRSRDNLRGYFVAWSHQELAKRAQQSQ